MAGSVLTGAVLTQADRDRTIATTVMRGVDMLAPILRAMVVTAALGPVRQSSSTTIHLFCLRSMDVMQLPHIKQMTHRDQLHSHLILLLFCLRLFDT